MGCNSIKNLQPINFNFKTAFSLLIQSLYKDTPQFEVLADTNVY